MSWSASGARRRARVWWAFRGGAEGGDQASAPTTYVRAIAHAPKHSSELAAPMGAVIRTALRRIRFILGSLSAAGMPWHISSCPVRLDSAVHQGDWNWRCTSAIGLGGAPGRLELAVHQGDWTRRCTSAIGLGGAPGRLDSAVHQGDWTRRCTRAIGLGGAPVRPSAALKQIMGRHELAPSDPSEGSGGKLSPLAAQPHLAAQARIGQAVHIHAVGSQGEEEVAGLGACVRALRAARTGPSVLWRCWRRPGCRGYADGEHGGHSFALHIPVRICHLEGGREGGGEAKEGTAVRRASITCEANAMSKSFK